MGTASSVVLRSPMIRKVCYLSAAIVIVGHAIAALVLRQGNTGVFFRTSDQYAMFGIGCVIGIAILMCSRCYISADAQGVETCTCGVHHFYPWANILGFEFDKYFGYLVTDNDDRTFLPVINIYDKEYAVKNLQCLRDLLAQYRP